MASHILGSALALQIISLIVEEYFPPGGAWPDCCGGEVQVVTLAEVTVRAPALVRPARPHSLATISSIKLGPLVRVGGKEKFYFTHQQNSFQSFSFIVITQLQ